MQKVITINLNGNAYQLDEAGYEALRAYLSHAQAQLGGNPDATEIIRDLEQSIAEKCQRLLGPGKSVVTHSRDRADPARDWAGRERRRRRARIARGGPSAATPQPKRLYQIREGAIVSGVANGLAAYFNVDPTDRPRRSSRGGRARDDLVRSAAHPHHRAVRAAHVYGAVREDAGRTCRGARRLDGPPLQAAARGREGEGQIRWPSPQSSVTVG